MEILNHSETTIYPLEFTDLRSGVINDEKILQIIKKYPLEKFRLILVPQRVIKKVQRIWGNIDITTSYFISAEEFLISYNTNISKIT